MVNILIADDHAIVRSGLRQILATSSDFTVVGEAGCGAEVLSKLRACPAALLVLDMSMPGVSGIDLIRRVHSEHPALPILVLSMHNETQVVSRALRAGAAGYLTKDSDPEVLLSAIRKLAAGGRFIDPKLVDAVVFATHADEAPPHEVLSDREFQVLQMLAAGKSISEIADAFSLSAKTVSTHKMRLMQKLDLENNAALIRYAIKHGLTTS
ncbi:response regulator transcription factor [Trinickia terrae]|uniref:Response regulator transcription factor n=1 Tax=Trinickia terrae TaxID=2571161 RepID=A0A4U1HPC5_9BURK|nr:response regulator transcription factor [Trinickia terrae]TKC81314.1 response regulator transcription factor [Trinickia terrae]